MSTEPINPAAVMADHEGVQEMRLLPPHCDQCGASWPCESYRLAEALAAEIETSRRMAQRIIDQSQALAAERTKVARALALIVPGVNRPPRDIGTADLRDALADQPEHVHEFKERARPYDGMVVQKCIYCGDEEPIADQPDYAVQSRARWSASMCAKGCGYSMGEHVAGIFCPAGVALADRSEPRP